MGQQRHQLGPSGTEVEQLTKETGGGGVRARAPRGLPVSLHIYNANMLKSLKARSKQADSDLALMGHPNAFPSVTTASASDWTIRQSMRVETLRHTMALKSGKCRTWKMPVDQLTKEAGDMLVLVCYLKEQERRVSPTVHAPVLLMPTQKFMRAMLEIENAFEPTGPFTMSAAQLFAFL